MFLAGLLPNSVNCLTDGMVERVRAVWFPTAPVAPSMMTLFGFGMDSFSYKEQLILLVAIIFQRFSGEIHE